MQIITISRGSLRGAKQLAENLSDEPGIPLYKREQIFEEAEKYSIADTGFCDISFIDRAPSIWERQSYRRKHYLLGFQAALLDMASKGSFIYEGHLGQYLLSGIPFILRLRAIQKFENRVNYWEKENKVSHEHAVNYIKLIDERRRHWSDYLYGVNIEESMYYDLVINLETMNVGTAAKVVKTALEQPEFNSNDETMKIMNDLHLSALSKLYLHLSPVTRGLELDVISDSGIGEITIKGLDPQADPEKFEQYIRNVLVALPAVQKVHFNY